MSYKTNLEFAYHMGYEDALARKMPDVDKVAVLLPDVADGAGEYICGTDGHEGHWLTGEEIVRCRDCKRVTIDQGDHDYREPLWCGLFRMDVSLDGFCKWGKRREDA